MCALRCMPLLSRSLASAWGSARTAATAGCSSSLQQLRPYIDPQLQRGYSDVPDLVPIKQQTSPAQRAAQQQTQPAAAGGTWTSVKDKSTGLTYWWNQQTGATTPVGAPKPDEWVPVKDERSGSTYWWNQQSGDTTAVGEPMPGPEGLVRHNTGGYPPGLSPTSPTPGPTRGLVQALTYPLAMGFGVGLTFAVIRMFVG